MSWRSRLTRAEDGGVLYFADRREAGRRLASRLSHLRGEDLVVLGLPRGGVPVAAEVAESIDAPLDVLVVRKLGVPWQPELAMGAIGEGDVRVLNREVVAVYGIGEGTIREVEAQERVELQRRVDAYREEEPGSDLTGRTAVIVDDGIATGSTALAAVDVARARGARRIVVAAPVASRRAAETLRAHADEVVCLGTPEDFGAIGTFYRDFSQTTDEEVRALLAASRRS